MRYIFHLERDVHESEFTVALTGDRIALVGSEKFRRLLRTLGKTNVA